MKKGIITISIFIILSIHLLYISFAYPYIGLEVVKKDGVYIVDGVHNISWAKYKDIRIGDQLLLVNGEDPNEYDLLVNRERIERAENITLLRDGHEIYVDIHNEINTDYFMYHVLIPLSLMIIQIPFLFYLNFVEKDKKVTYPLILLFSLYLLGITAAGASARADFLGTVVTSASLLFFPIALFHFLYWYFKGYDIKVTSNINIIRAIYGFNIFLVLLVLFYQEFVPVLKLMVLFWELIMVITIAILFFLSFRKYKNSMIGSVFKILGLSLIISHGPFYLFYAIPQLIFGVTVIDSEPLVLFFYILPLTLLYITSSNRLFDVDFYISKIVYYGFFNLIPASFLVLVISAILNQTDLTEKVKLFVLIFTTLTALSMIKERIKYTFRGEIFQGKSNFKRSFYQYAKFLSDVSSREDITKKLIDTLKEVLPIKEVGMYKYEKKKKEIIWLHGDHGIDENENYDWEVLIGVMKPGEISETPLGDFIIINELHDKVTLLYLGEKNNKTKFNIEEKEWISNIALLTSLVFENTIKFETLLRELDYIKVNDDQSAWIKRFLFRLQESERRRLAIDLHDSVLQELLQWYRYLDLYMSSNEREEEMLFKIRDGLLNTIKVLRDTCFELRPPYLNEAGIVKAIQNLVGVYENRYNFKVNFSHRNFTEKIDEEIKTTIYRITQELFSNAAKHSKASRIDYTLSYMSNTLFIEYKDNGVGMSGKIYDPNKQIGLSGIKERVQSFGGSIDIFGEGKGVHILLEIPVGDKEVSV